MGVADSGGKVGLPKQHNEAPGIFRRSLNTSCLNFENVKSNVTLLKDVDAAHASDMQSNAGKYSP